MFSCGVVGVLLLHMMSFPLELKFWFEKRPLVSFHHISNVLSFLILYILEMFE